MGIHIAEDDKGENGGGKNSKKGEKIDPGRRVSFYGEVLANGV